MSRNDIEWCFGGEVDFADLRSGDLLLSLEAPLVGFAEDLSQAVERLHRDGDYEIPDRYGSYRLLLAAEANTVTVSEVATGRTFAAELDQFISTMSNFAGRLVNSLLQLFPELDTNAAFNSIWQDIDDRLSAARRD
jgi:hypothetical protein